MPERKGFWKKLEQSKKMQMLFFVVSMVVIIGAYFPLNNIARNSREKQNIKEVNVSIDYDLLYDFENIESINERIKFEGWALRLNSKNLGISIVLKATDGSDEKVLFTEMTERKDVEQYFGEDTDFGESGFAADIKKSQLADDICYEIQLALHYEGEPDAVGENEFYTKVSTNKYLYGGKMYGYNPKEIAEPVFSDDQLSNVIKEGELCVSQPEKGVWIYYYQNKIYWVLDKKFSFDEDGKTYVPYHIYPVKIENLPENRQIYGFEYNYFFFEENELLEENGYRVAVKEISRDYKIAYIVTGVFNESANKWVWHMRVQVPYIRLLYGRDEK